MSRDDVHVELDVAHGHSLLQFRILPRRAIDGFWNEFEDEIEVDFVLLGLNSTA